MLDTGEELPVAQLLLLAHDRIEPIAVDGDELALRQVTVNEACGLDRGRAAVLGLLGVVAAEDEPARADKDDRGDPAEQQFLPLGFAGVERGKAFARAARLGGDG